MLFLSVLERKYEPEQPSWLRSALAAVWAIMKWNS